MINFYFFFTIYVSVCAVKVVNELNRVLNNLEFVIFMCCLIQIFYFFYLIWLKSILRMFGSISFLFFCRFMSIISIKWRKKIIFFFPSRKYSFKHYDFLSDLTLMNSFSKDRCCSTFKLFISVIIFYYFNLDFLINFSWWCKFTLIMLAKKIYVR